MLQEKINGRLIIGRLTEILIYERILKKYPMGVAPI